MKRFSPLSVILLMGLTLVLVSSRHSQHYIVGEKAEDFSLKDTEGKMVTMADYKDAKGFIIVFTCNHCPYAQLYEKRIADLHRKFAPLGMPVIAINPNDPDIVPDDSYTAMQKRAKDKKYPYAYLFDEKQLVYPKFGATRTPHVFVLDKDRIVRYIGAIDDNPETPEAVKKRYVDDAATAVLRGQKPAPDFTRAVGCTIKKK